MKMDGPPKKLAIENRSPRWGSLFSGDPRRALVGRIYETGRADLSATDAFRR